MTEPIKLILWNMSVFLTWEKEIHGLLNYSILDFDHDGENELLAVFLEPYANNNSGVQTPQKQLILRMYEHEDGTIKILLSIKHLLTLLISAAVLRKMEYF